MSKVLKKLADIKIVSVILGVILVAATALGIVCNALGWGVFNQDALLKDTQTITVSINVTGQRLEKARTCSLSLLTSSTSRSLCSRISVRESPTSS